VWESHLVPVDVDDVDAVTNVAVDAADVVAVAVMVAVVVAAAHTIDPDRSCHC